MTTSIGSSPNDTRGRADAGKAGVGGAVGKQAARTLKKLPLLADSRAMKRGSSLSAPAATRWIDRWLDACSDLADLSRSNPMTDAVIDEIDGRMIRIGDAWLADFASCNYLGFDLEREIIEAV